VHSLRDITTTNKEKKRKTSKHPNLKVWMDGYSTKEFANNRWAYM